MGNKTIVGEGENSKEATAQRRRTQRFIEEVEARGGYKKIYQAEHTNIIIQQQHISLDNFYKLFERMVDGGGLFAKPVLLSAILRDMAYPADCLFQDNNIPLSSTTLELGPGVANELKNIMCEAFQEISKKTPHQASFMKRILGANCILTRAKEFREKDYLKAINYLFYQYSIFDHRLYPHSQSRDIEQVDKLCKYCMEYNSVVSGSLLTLAFLLYEINKISNSLLYFTTLCRKRPEARRPLIEGFLFKDNLSETDVRHHLSFIQKSFEKVVNKYFDSELIKLNNGTIMKLEEKLSLTNTNVIQCLQYAEKCLEKIINFEIKAGVKSSSGRGMIDFQFDMLVGLNPKISPHFRVIFDTSLNDDLKYLSTYLTNFYDSSFVM